MYVKNVKNIFEIQTYRCINTQVRLKQNLRPNACNFRDNYP